MSTIIYTRYGNPALFSVSAELTKSLGWERVAMANTSADGYLQSIFRQSPTVKWIINIDDDAFLTRPESIKELMAYMEAHDYDYCGIGDGANNTIRWIYNPCSMNPFFNIFHMERLRAKIDFTKPIGIPWNTDLKSLSPPWIPDRPEISVEQIQWIPNKEPYYPFFFHLLRDCKPLFLNGTTWKDGITSILFDHRAQPFLYHSWFARLYGRGPSPFGEDRTNKERIEHLIEYVRGQVVTL